MEIGLLNRKIEIDKKLLLYNNLRKDFITLINNNIDFFTKKLDESNSIEELLNVVPNAANACIDTTVEHAIQILVYNKVFDYSKKVFKDKYIDEYFDYSQYYYEVKNIYLEIIGQEEELRTNRAIERNSRSKWQGGGFGLNGAIKGAVTAGILNAGTGLIRGIGDSIVNSSDRSKIKELKSALFNNQKVRDYLINGILECTCGVFHALIEILNQISNEDLGNFDFERAEAIFENVRKYIEDDNEIIEAIVECIKLCPYNEEYYLFLILRFNDPKNEIENIANLFGYYGIRDFKIMCLDEQKKKFLDKHLGGEQLPQGGYRVNYNNMKADVKEIENLAKKLNVDYSTDIEDIYKAISKVEDLGHKKQALSISLNMPESNIKEIKEKVTAIESYSQELNVDNSKIINELKKNQEKLELLELVNETNNDSESSLAQFKLYEIYYNEQNTEMAKKYLIKSAKNGYKKAKETICEYYFRGNKDLNIEKDFEKAVNLLEEIYQYIDEYDKEDKMVFYEIGKCYFEGVDTEKDYEKANYWFNKSKSPESEYYLGIMYDEGKGVEKNSTKARDHFIKATDCPYTKTRELAKERLKKYKNFGDKEIKAKIKSIMEEDDDFKEEKEKSSIPKRILKVIVIFAIQGFLQEAFPVATDIFTIISVVMIIGALMGY